MTSAPMSARMWVAKGPAAACSKASTVTPLRAGSATLTTARRRLGEALRRRGVRPLPDHDAAGVLHDHRPILLHAAAAEFHDSLLRTRERLTLVDDLAL